MQRTLNDPGFTCNHTAFLHPRIQGSFSYPEDEGGWELRGESCKHNSMYQNWGNAANIGPVLVQHGMFPLTVAPQTYSSQFNLWTPLSNMYFHQTVYTSLMFSSQKYLPASPTVSFIILGKWWLYSLYTKSINMIWWQYCLKFWYLFVSLFVSEEVTQ